MAIAALPEPDAVNGAPADINGAINVSDVDVDWSKPLLIWKSPTCLKVPPPHPLLIVNGKLVQLINVSVLPSAPSSAETPILAQFICVLISIPVVPLLTIRLPLINSSEPSAIPIRSLVSKSTSGVGLYKYVCAVGPPL